MSAHYAQRQDRAITFDNTITILQFFYQEPSAAPTESATGGITATLKTSNRPSMGSVAGWICWILAGRSRVAGSAIDTSLRNQGI